ncbi:MAG: hypothetical protein GY754_37200, partial [bacterium]|nr:hypothetical protein [bacterium]
MKLKFKSFFGDRRGLSIFIFPALLLLSFTAFTAGCSGEGFDADDEVPESDPFTSSNSNSLRAYPIPHNGSPISMESGDRKIVITFTRSMNTNSLQLGGDLVEESFLHTWSSVYRDNDTLTVTPAPGYVWSPGINKTIIIACDDINGSALDTLKLNYHIAGKFIYVREDGTSTAPGGTAALPL